MKTKILYKVLVDPGKEYAKRVVSDHTSLGSAIHNKQRYEILNDSNCKIIKETTTTEEITVD